MGTVKTGSETCLFSKTSFSAKMQFISSTLKSLLIKSGQLEVGQAGIAQTGSGGIASSLFMVLFSEG